VGQRDASAMSAATLSANPAESMAQSARMATPFDAKRDFAI